MSHEKAERRHELAVLEPGPSSAAHHDVELGAVGEATPGHDPEEEFDRPVIVGRVEPGRASPTKLTRTQSLVLDGRELVLEADSSLTLRCGKSSITLTRDGRIVLRGTSLVSRASGVNRIQGGTIKLN